VERRITVPPFIIAPVRAASPALARTASVAEQDAGARETIAAGLVGPDSCQVNDPAHVQEAAGGSRHPASGSERRLDDTVEPGPEIDIQAAQDGNRTLERRRAEDRARTNRHLAELGIDV
jgi:hypothetical protein